MQRTVYINGHDISDYGAKLQTDYAITGCDVTNATNQGPNRSSVLLLRQAFSALHITLPLDFYGVDKRQTTARLSAFAALLTGSFEVDLGDGYQYTCILDEIGPTSWICDEICSVDVSMSGMRHTAPITVVGTGPLTVYNPGAWPQTACKIRVSALLPATEGTTSVIIRHDDGSALSYIFDTTKPGVAGGLTLDGLSMDNRLMGKPIAVGVMQWTDYPWLAPGENTILVNRLSANGTVTVNFTPTYL